ncbi:hypothetical protein SANTM175S_05817 [Streptomyces antimycoticus]
MVDSTRTPRCARVWNPRSSTPCAPASPRSSTTRTPTTSNEFARRLQQTGDVDEEVYQRVWRRWGEVGAVELSSVVGYYTLVAMTLNVHLDPAYAEAG